MKRRTAVVAALLLSACGVDEVVNATMGVEFGCCATFAGKNATNRDERITDWDCRDWSDEELIERFDEAMAYRNTFLCSFRTLEQ